MKLTIEIDEATLKELVLNHIQDKLGSIVLDRNKLKIETRSTQNYKAEWESADYRATYESSDA